MARGGAHRAGNSAGDSMSGITIMEMDEGIDTGNMLLKSEVKIAPKDTREDLENNLGLAGRKA